uniref:Pleckstrin homology-like domain family A member 2 n=1 Tax=Iconisemion striatum TaxID=60296 RepID=A0A1A7YV86_9TELE
MTQDKKEGSQTRTVKMSAEELGQVLKEGRLEKRSDNLLQFWKRKTCVLTTDGLNIYADTQKRTKSKELKLQSIKKVDCVERTGKFVYFTIVTTDNKEIDFRCSGEENGWNAVITMALIDYQNRKAVQDIRTRPGNESASPGQVERRMARAP